MEQADSWRMTPLVQGYHAHVYFAELTVGVGRALCEQAAARFSLKMGRVHERPVGPHPDWSCQLEIPTGQFADVVPWLMLNRAGLVVFIHPLTGDDLVDHRDHALWLGSSRSLDLSQFNA
jgi:aromatic ring-cleaving dioxygenase